MFSDRTSWPRNPNRLSTLLEKRRQSGQPIYDLTISNPTECGFMYPEESILEALSHRNVLHYRPDPKGILSARESISRYYSRKNVIIDPSRIFLTAGTSEAYSFLFRLLCNPGDSILIPRPGYPLFEYLAQLNDVRVEYYRLSYDDCWRIDLHSLREAVRESTRAIVVVNPHNPTGTFLNREEYVSITELARGRQLALIVDEVFIDFPLTDDAGWFGTTAGAAEILTFTLNGISKLCALPQAKVGWLVLSGPELLVGEASERLEILCDTFLSVNTPAQEALPTLLEVTQPTREAVSRRIRSNYRTLQEDARGTRCSILNAMGGWYAILRVPRTRPDEIWAETLLTEKGIFVFPGYFFDFESEGYLVVSLLPEERLFSEAISELRNLIEAST